MKVGVPTETKPDEYRVAITPAGVRATSPSTATRWRSSPGPARAA